LLVHPASLKVALSAAKKVGLAHERIALLKEAKPTTNVGNFLNIDTLVQGTFPDCDWFVIIITQTLFVFQRA
jgi:hypothetical protein